jgi:hypothetical protein
MDFSVAGALIPGPHGLIRHTFSHEVIENTRGINMILLFTFLKTL